MKGIKMPKNMLRGPKFNLSSGLGNSGLAGGMAGMPKAPIMIRSYADYKNLHFAPMQSTKIRLG